MAGENDDNRNDDQNHEQQNNNEQQNNEQQSTGNEVWDKLIDGVAGTGTKPENKDENNNEQQRRTTADRTQQGDRTQQQQRIDPNNREQQGTRRENANTQQRGQGDGEHQEVQQVRSPARKFGDLFQADTKGDIYDVNGALVARQGAQRMIFHRLWPTIEANARELGGMRERIRNYEEANTIAKKEGLSLDEHGAALQMFVQWKRDPIKTMNTLLTLAEQGGKDVSSIRQGGGLSIADVRAAVSEIVGESVKPFSFLSQQREDEQRFNEVREQVATDYAAFMEEFPDARIHEDALARVMADKNLSNREAYFAVRAFAAERGLDWTKPLAPQLQGKPSGDGQNRRQIPSMGGRGQREEAHVEHGANDQANANDSWDAIARRAMKKHGIPVG